MTNPVISLDSVSLSYALYKRPLDIILEQIRQKKIHDDFWALKDISFDLNEKQRLGIIGANGSGKSTLLKIITGHLRPSSGICKVNGRISAMLSLSTMLNPEETGIDNIRFNLLIAGTPKRDVEDYVDEIIDFTELGQFIYSPVKTYSSGMRAKLAFAINTSIEPEILVIDEVLSVGDAYFVGKATARMKALCDRGKALVFVSHSNAAVQMLCDTVLWLDNGIVRGCGPAEKVLKEYEDDYKAQEDILTRPGNREKSIKRQTIPTLPGLTKDFPYRVRLNQRDNLGSQPDTYYVRSLTVDNTSIDLESPPSIDTSIASLDLFSSEWSRFSTKGGFDARILSKRTGRNPGGQIILNHNLLNSSESVIKIELKSVYQSIATDNPLQIEYLDLLSTQWKNVSDQTDIALNGGWMMSTATLSIPKLSHLQIDSAFSKIEELNRPDVQIGDIVVKSKSSESSVINEREPFSIHVNLHVTRPVQDIDVGLKITRSDGTYVFWQSNGVVGFDLGKLTQDCAVCFSFDDNNLAAGLYQLTAYIATKWDYPDNYPYSEVYDRVVFGQNLLIRPESTGLDFGLINQRVPVTLLRS